MNLSPNEQSKLFTAARERFKKWTSRQVSGYVHGVTRGLAHDRPHQDYIDAGKKREKYALGYIQGFIDAYGTDALAAKWCSELAELNLVLFDCNYRWWNDEK